MSEQWTLDPAAEFPILNRMVFFNHAGVGPISGRAAAALRDYAQQAANRAYVKAGWYRRANEVKKLTATMIGAAGPHEIAFVPNTSTGISMVAKGIDWRRGEHVVITSVEYPANRYPWEDLRRFGVEVIEVPQRPDGAIDVQDVCEAVTDRTRVVSISHVQWASGCRVDLRPISDTVHRVGGHMCVDAIQSMGTMPIDVDAAGIDFLSADGHKWLLSPEGCGVFYCREELITRLHPNIVGWMNMMNATDWGNYQFEFERTAQRFEPGSYNIPGILALGASMELLLEVGLAHVWSRIERLTARLVDGLHAKGYRVFSPRGEGQRSGIVSFEPPSAGGNKAAPSIENIVADLEAQDIVIAIREGRLRASPHFYNTDEQVDRLIDLLP